MTNAEYRKIEAISNSDLSYIETNPYLYALKHRPQIESKALDFGTLIHSLTLEPEKFKDEYAVEDFEGCELNKNSKAYKEARAKWLESIKDKTIVSKSDYEKALILSERARKLIEPLNGKAEQSFVANWNEQIKVKCRPDFLTDDGLLIDLKTTSTDIINDYLLAKTIYDRKYHRQLAFYKMVLELCNIEVKECILIFANTSNLWVRGVRVSQEDIQRGHNDAIQILDRYNSILRNGLTLEGLFETISLPTY